MSFEPNLDSLKQHKIPAWYDDGKLGIFIHWGLFSVPGWAPLYGDISKMGEQAGWQNWFENNSYAEWYLNSLKFETGPTRKFHDATYGPDFSYDDFVPQLNAAVAQWNPDEWAALFQKVGARYAVLTTKHHDGFTLWPTTQPSPHKPNYYVQRDLVGELAQALRARGLRMGLYYSGGLDWAFNPARVQDIQDVWGTIVQEPVFVEYSLGHWRELIDRYQPSILWNDIGFPRAANLPELFAYFYNNMPDGVVNDRFGQAPYKRSANKEETVSWPLNPHYDFVTPEYKSFNQIQAGKWEATRGFGHSFGYNRNETDEQLLSERELIHMFADVVSKNGNLLLNIGPIADGTIPQNQRQRLESLGRWLDVNGEAIFGTRPWTRAEGQAMDGTNSASTIQVRFTKRDNTLYATLLGTPISRQIGIEGLTADRNTTVQLLGRASVLHWQQDGDSLAITLPDDLPETPAHSLKFTALL